MKRRMNKEALVDALLRKAVYTGYIKDKTDYGADYYTLPKDITKYFAMRMPKYVVKKVLGSKNVGFVDGFVPYDDDEDRVYETLTIAYGDSLPLDSVVFLYNGLAEEGREYIVLFEKADRDYYM